MNYTSSWNNREDSMIFYDFLNRASSLTVRKVLNYSLIQASYLLAVLLKKPVVWGKPFFISLEPAAICNLACPQCPTGAGEVNRGQKFLDMDTFRKVVDETAGTALAYSLYHQGEPLMNNAFTEMVKYAAGRKAYTVTSTNGQWLTEKVCRGLVDAGLDRIIISLDGTDQESYEKYRIGGDFNKVLSGIRMLSEARQGRRKPFIVIQFLVFKHNQEDVSEMAGMGKRLGADRVLIKSAQIEYPETITEWIPDLKDYRRYTRRENGNWELRGKLKNRCRRLWQTTVVTTDGLVTPCCFDKLAKFPLGKTENGTISQIWKGREYKNFRKKVLCSRKKIGICTNCTEGIGRVYR
jgi:radical SAM protein with 4Fe4S-binding SPASM domain